MPTLKLFFTGLIFSVSSFFSGHHAATSTVLIQQPSTVRASSSLEEASLRSSSTVMVPQKAVPVTHYLLPSASFPKPSPSKAPSIKTVATTSVMVPAHADPTVPTPKETPSGSSSSVQSITPQSVPHGGGTSPAPVGTVPLDPTQEAQDVCDELDEGVSCQVGQYMTGTCQVRGEFFACFPQ